MNMNSLKKPGFETKKLFELHTPGHLNQGHNNNPANMISISSQFNKPDNADKDKPRRGRRPNAIKNYA